MTTPLEHCVEPFSLRVQGKQTLESEEENPDRRSRNRQGQTERTFHEGLLGRETPTGTPRASTSSCRHSPGTHTRDSITLEIYKVLSRPSQLPHGARDPLDQLPTSVTSLIAARPQDVLELAYEGLCAFPFQDVPGKWRRAYEEARWQGARMVVGKRVAKAAASKGECESNVGGKRVESSDGDRTDEEEEDDDDDWVDEVVENLDMALIMTGAPARGACIEEVMRLLARLDAIPRVGRDAIDSLAVFGIRGDERASKRRKVAASSNGDSHATKGACEEDAIHRPRWFCDENLPVRHPPLREDRSIARKRQPSVLDFQRHLDHGKGAQPLILTDTIAHWPALGGREDQSIDRRWNNRQYFDAMTLGGRRRVPIEIGQSYTDDGWGQKIVRVGDFVDRYMTRQPPPQARHGSKTHARDDWSEIASNDDSGATVAYLAQYDLFAQIPALRSDIAVPDYCYATPPRGVPVEAKNTGTAPETGASESEAQVAEDAEPVLNAWFGPAGTVSPAHTDPHHNVLAQVVGSKYLRLFSPSETAKLYPRGAGEDGVDMSNTSAVDVGLGMKVLEGFDWDERDGLEEDDGNVAQILGCEPGSEDGLAGERGEFEQRFPLFAQAAYCEAVLKPGECLYVPKGWWHYVRSLTPSFSVSFWWD